MALITLYYSIFYPYFSYCIHVWGSACRTHLNDIVVLQKEQKMRIISGLPPRVGLYTDPLFKRLGILKIKHTFRYCIGILMFVNLSISCYHQLSLN